MSENAALFWLEQIKKRKREVKLVLEQGASSKTMPEGYLKIRASNGAIQYYQVADGVERYIPKDCGKKAEQLAQKSYSAKVKRAAEKELQNWNKVEETLKQMVPFESVYEGLRDERKSLIQPGFLTREAFVEQWLEEDYEKGWFREGAPFYETDSGERVRSKSEVLIANKLELQGVPFKYERPLRLQKPRPRIVRPDFTVLNVRTREEFYWEHFGRMDDPEYTENMAVKMAEYQANGLFYPMRFIFTFESASNPLNPKDLDEIIESYLK